MSLSNLNVTFRPFAHDRNNAYYAPVGGLDAMAGNAHHVLVIEDDAETAEQLVDCVRTTAMRVAYFDGWRGRRKKIAIGLAWAAGLFLVLATAAGISTSRRSVALVEAINATAKLSRIWMRSCETFPHCCGSP
jgi:hypothetical protein